MILGSVISRPSLNEWRWPRTTYKRVQFADVTAYGRVEKRPLDSPFTVCAANHLPLNQSIMLGNSIMWEDDCQFPFHAISHAQQLRFDIVQTDMHDAFQLLMQKLSCSIDSSRWWSAPLSFQAVLSCPDLHQPSVGFCQHRWSAPLSFQAVSSCPYSFANNPIAQSHHDVYPDISWMVSNQPQGSQSEFHASTPVSTPISHSSSVTTHPGEHDLPPGLQELWNVVFCRQAERDDLDAPKHITILTWYLDHQRHRVCSADRPIALDRAWQFWVEELKDLWRDRCDQALPLLVTLIHPEPPRGTGEFHNAQVVLTQHDSHEVSALITAVFEMQEGPKRAWRSAFVLPAAITQFDVLDKIPGGHGRSEHAFWVVHDETVLGTELHPIEHGAGIVAIKGLSRENQILDPVVHQRTHGLATQSMRDEDEEIALVQTQIQVDLSHGHQTAVPSLCPSAAPTDLPGTTDLNHQEIPEHVEEVPDYMQNVQAHAAQHFLRNENDYTIRTWYIHHSRVWYWNQPRILSFPARDIVQWQACHFAILDAWEDRIDEEQDMVFAEVFPRMLHDVSDQQVHVDLILSQGITAPRNAIIMTLLGDRTGRILRRAAISSPILVSGLRLLNLAAYDDQCDPNNCHMWHVGTQLTITNVPDFRSRDGQSVVVRVHEDDAIAASSHHTPCSPESISPQSYLGPNPASDVADVRVLRMYRLFKPMESAAVAWHSYAQLMFNVSRALSIPITDVQQVHETTVETTGQTDHETVVVLQTVGDIDPGSDEQLILVDCEVHLPHRVGSPPIAPKVERFVLKVVKHLVRIHLLQVAGIASELGRSLHGCLVYHNHELWATQDLGTHTFQSGDYIRIIAPPPDDADRVNSDQDSDEGSLLQLDIHRFSQPHMPNQAHDLSLVFNEPADPSLPCSANRVTLCLDECIAKPKWTFVDCRRVQFLHFQLSHCILPQPRFSFEEIEWHPAAAQAIQNTPRWTDEKPIAFWFFTDGSIHHDAASCTVAAAAVVLVVETAVGDRFGGFHEYHVDGKQSAQRAENTAILGASFWALQLIHAWKPHCQPQVHFCFDSTTAGYANEGSWHSHLHHDLTTLVRSITHWIEEITRHSVQWSHVYSHCGNAWNEMADCVAWHYARTADRRIKLDALCQLCTFDGQHPRLHHWLWYYERALQGHAQAPVVADGFFKFNVAAPFEAEPSVHLHPVIRRQQGPDDVVRCTTRCALQVATANVLTLFAKEDDTGAFRSTRMEALVDQFQQHGYHAIGLQETRSKMSGHTKFHGYHILAGPATQHGHAGVQLWIAEVIPTHDQPLKIAIQHLHVLHASSRRLVVRLSHPGLKLILVVAYSPTEGTEQATRSFWQATSHAIPAKYRSWTTLLLVDANSRVGEHVSPAVGPHDADEESCNGAIFHEWLQQHRMFLPQTFDSCHRGLSPTWTHATGSQARIDYIALSDNVPHDQVHTRIDENVDLVVTRPDHSCVGASIELPVSTICSTPWSSRPPTSTATELPTVGWNTDVHTHAATLQIRMLPQDSHTRRRTPHKWHMQPHTWQLIQSKAWHFCRLQQVKRTFRSSLLREIFAAWRTGQSNVTFSVWHRSCLCQIAFHDFQARRLAIQVKEHVRKDDKAFYENLASQMAEAAHDNPKSMWQAMKPVLPKALKRRQANLRCVGPSIQQKCDHFCNLEAGEELDYSTIVQQCHQRQSKAQDDMPIQLSLNHLPSKQDIEEACKMIQNGKAPGLDTIAPDVVKSPFRSLATDISDLFVKSFVLGAEPVQFKGGLIHTIGKKKLSTDVKDLRGIMLLDCLAKLYHSILRKRLMSYARCWQQPMQLGGYPGQQTQYATQYIRTFAALAQQRSLSTAVIFLDLRSAFHHLIRETIFGNGADTLDVLDRCLQDTGFDVDAMKAEYATLSADFLQDVDPLTQQLLRDAHCNTWFTVAQHDQTYCTHRGSRPGSPLADLAFNAMMSGLIRDLQQDLDALSPLQAAFSVLELRAPLVAWVDDLAIPLVACDADAIEGIVQQAMQCTLKNVPDEV